jgi:hypothetical protein
MQIVHADVQTTELFDNKPTQFDVIQLTFAKQTKLNISGRKRGTSILHGYIVI